MTSEENENPLIINHSGGLIRRMDNQLELMNRVLGEISERKSEIIPAASSFMGSRAGEERDWEIAPGVKMTFCWCPPGEFLMGSPETEEGRFDGENQVLITLTKGFWMAKTQVTQKHWAAIMGNNPSYFKGENLPVEEVSWHDAQQFIKELNAKIANRDGGKMVLPTEAKWEYACRAGEIGPYSGGTLDAVAWYAGNSAGKTHPVGMKKPNAWGISDMHGNVWEWCEDWYSSKGSNIVDRTKQPLVAGRVSRGGGWGHFAKYCRASIRAIGSPVFKDKSFGFRIARIST